MKKQSVKNLKLNKKSISNLGTENVKGGTGGQLLSTPVFTECFGSIIDNCPISQNCPPIDTILCFR